MATPEDHSAPHGFEAPNWEAPLDAEAVIEKAPRSATVKGMFLAALVAQVEREGLRLDAEGPYRAFREYPLRELMRLEVEAAPKLFPGYNLREGLRRIGWSSFPLLLNTHIGRVMFGVLGNNLPLIFGVASRAYRICLSEGRVDMAKTEENTARLRMLNINNFISSYQVGVIEGLLRHFDCEGEVFIESEADENDMELFVRWKQSSQLAA